VNIKKTIEDGMEGSASIVGGIIEEHRAIITKKGEHMAFIKVSDFTGTIEVVVFPKTLAECKDIVAPDRMVVIKGRFSKRNDSPSVIAEKVKILE